MVDETPRGVLCANTYDRTDDVGNTQEHVRAHRRARGDGVGSHHFPGRVRQTPTCLGVVATVWDPRG